MSTFPVSADFLQHVVLPERALLQSTRDHLIPARALSLNLAKTRAERVRHKRPDERDAAVLDVCWEARTSMELAARVARLLTDPQDVVTGRWVQYTEHEYADPHQFYEGKRQWSRERYLVLAGTHLRADDRYVSVFDELVPPEDERYRAALDAAGDATASYLERVIGNLRSAWLDLRRFSLASEHGLLLIPHANARVTDADGNNVEHDLLVWETKHDAAVGMASSDAGGVLGRAADVADLALRLVDHVLDVRLGVSDVLFGHDGALRLDGVVEYRPKYWCEKDALDDATQALLSHPLRLNLVDEPVRGAALSSPTSAAT